MEFRPGAMPLVAAAALAVFAPQRPVGATGATRWNKRRTRDEEMFTLTAPRVHRILNADFVLLRV